MISWQTEHFNGPAMAEKREETANNKLNSVRILYLLLSAEQLKSFRTGNYGVLIL